MRILVVTPTYLPIIGGAETAIFEIYRRLRERHTVRILTPRLSALELARHSANDTLFDEQALAVRRFYDRLTFGRGSVKKLYEQLIPPVSFSYLWPLVREVVCFKPDVINLHYLFPGALVLPAARLLRVPTLLSLVSRTDVFGRDNQVFRQHAGCMQRLSAKASKITALTNYMITDFSEAARVEVVPYGADTSRYTPEAGGQKVRRLLNIPESAPVLFSLQRLAAVKKINLLLEAFALVKRELPSARLVLGGKGPEAEALRALTLRLGLQEAVTFAGFIPEADLPSYLAASSCFVFSSSQETFGIVLAQALASGRPVVAFNSSCLSEVVKDRVEGLLVPNEDVPALAAAVIELLRDEELYRSLAKGARARAVRSFGWEIIALKYEILLQEAVKTREVLCKRP